jgi:hypothetical protein
MKLTWTLAAVLGLPAVLSAQSGVPAGTILPVSLDKSVNVRKVHPGEEVRAKVMQDIPGTSIRRGAEVIGRVVEANLSPGGLARLGIRFDSVRQHGQSIPVTTNLRALASFLEVEQAQVPEDMSSRGLTPETWTTQQIGGDQVYRGGGPVAVGIEPVGESTFYGVLGMPLAQHGQPCRGVVADANRPQAFWLFSTSACGVYGYAGVRIEHSGRTDPDGVIVLVRDGGDLNLRIGSGMLLRVHGGSATMHS